MIFVRALSIAWKRFRLVGEILAALQSEFVLMLFYVFVIGPLSLTQRREHKSVPEWHSRTIKAASITDARRQG